MRATVALSALALAGCVLPYRPPRPDEPHAILKLRRVYEVTNGPKLHERAKIGRNELYENTINSSELQEEARVDAILVHPRTATFEVSGTFFHLETKMVNEQYTESVPYSSTESYSCGDYKAYRTCTRTVTRYRTEYKTRLVSRTVSVTDGICGESVALTPRAGHTYLLQYTYQQSGACSLHCYEQISLPDGRFEQQPCPAPEAPR